MVFSSPTFIFLFLPIVLAVYFLVPKWLKNIFLMIASLFFYAWGEMFYAGVMIASIVINYFFGLMVERYRHGRAMISFAVAVNLSLLISYKYANFIVDNLNHALSFNGLEAIILAPVHLPIGISFFTFHSISYLVDIHRGGVNAQRNFINVALYISFFPQLIAGPIIRYHDVDKQIESRKVTLDDFNYGARRFIIGFAKKMIIANPLGGVADKIFAIPVEQLSPEAAWLGIACYTLQIYFDFSGYSDMAIGLGRMFGFHFLENFNYPYIAHSMQEFWRRWHMSLSRWFRDYLYIPLGGNRMGTARTYINLITVFALCGLWHGSSWNFLIWGLIHGAFLVLERNSVMHALIARHRIFGHLYVMLVVMVAWVFFRSDTLEHSLSYLSQMFFLGPAGGGLRSVGEFTNPEVIVMFTIGVIMSMPIVSSINAWWNRKYQVWSNLVFMRKVLMPTGNALVAVLYIELFLTAASYLAVNTYNPFIYFRF